MSQYLRSCVSVASVVALFGGLGCAADDVRAVDPVVVWSTVYESPVDTLAHVDGDGTVVLGRDDQPYIARLDSAGAEVWRHTVSSNAGSISRADTGADGHVVVLGRCSGPLQFAGLTLCEDVDGANALVVVELDPHGEGLRGTVFQPTFGLLSADSIAVDPSGGYYLAGTLAGDVDFGTGVLSTGGQSVFLAAFDAQGEVRFASLFGGGSAQVSDLSVHGPSGDLLIVGRFQGVVGFGDASLASGPNGPAMFFARLDRDGQARWAKHYLGNAAMTARFDGAGAILITGMAHGYLTSFGGDKRVRGPFATKWSASGAHQWTWWHGADAQEGAVAVDSQGRIVALIGRNVLVKEAVEGVDYYDYEPAEYVHRRALVILDSTGEQIGKQLLGSHAGYNYREMSLSVGADDTILAGVPLSDEMSVNFGDGPIVGPQGHTAVAKLFLVEL